MSNQTISLQYNKKYYEVNLPDYLAKGIDALVQAKDREFRSMINTQMKYTD